MRLGRRGRAEGERKESVARWCSQARVLRVGARTADEVCGATGQGEGGQQQQAPPGGLGQRGRAEGLRPGRGYVERRTGRSHSRICRGRGWWRGGFARGAPLERGGARGLEPGDSYRAIMGAGVRGSGRQTTETDTAQSRHTPSQQISVRHSHSHTISNTY